MARPTKLTAEDVGAAMMAWYADAIKQYPQGLITQAQASIMLGVSRVAVSRLVTRGYLRAVYFPKPPDIVGLAVGQDDPTWLRIVGWLGDCETYAFPKACFVSFGDVTDLWQSGEAKKKCNRDWNEVMADIFAGRKRDEVLKAKVKQHQLEAERQRRKRGETRDSKS